MDKISVMLKTIGGVMCLVSTFLLTGFVSHPNPPIYVALAQVVIVFTTTFTGIGLLVSAMEE